MLFEQPTPSIWIGQTNQKRHSQAAENPDYVSVETGEEKA